MSDEELIKLAISAAPEAVTTVAVVIMVGSDGSRGAGNWSEADAPQETAVSMQLTRTGPSLQARPWQPRFACTPRPTTTAIAALCTA
jgi:hypothetical protein